MKDSLQATLDTAGVHVANSYQPWSGMMETAVGPLLDYHLSFV